MSSYLIKSPLRFGLPAVAHKLLTFLIALASIILASQADAATCFWVGGVALGQRPIQRRGLLLPEAQREPVPQRVAFRSKLPILQLSMERWQV
jgi:hypothetical protein